VLESKAIEIKFPFEYRFNDYHEEPFYTSFLSDITGKKIKATELSEFEDSETCGVYWFRFEVEE